MAVQRAQSPVQLYAGAVILSVAMRISGNTPPECVSVMTLMLHGDNWKPCYRYAAFARIAAHFVHVL
jgi:hypothetical protein